MASYTTHYNIKKPTFFESADVLDVNANMDILDTTVYNVQNSIAPDFSSSSTYEVDDLVIYNSLLYKCTTAVTTAGAWNSANWTREYAVNTGGGGGSSLPDYSTTEQNTGRKWVDGKDIYVKTISLSNIGIVENSRFTIQHGITGIDKMVALETQMSTEQSGYNGGVVAYPVYSAWCTITELSLSYATEWDASSSRVWNFTIYYTKTAS